MRLRSPRQPNLARSIAAILVMAGIPALALGSGCGDHAASYPAPSESPNKPPNDGGTSTSDGGTVQVDLCACAAVLDETDCFDCIKLAIAAGAPCADEEGDCEGSSGCVTDAECIGSCIHVDAAEPDGACIAACLTAATKEYLAYLTCSCKRCPVCTSDVTCPAP